MIRPSNHRPAFIMAFLLFLALRTMPAAEETVEAKTARMLLFKAARLGIFIPWGI